MKNEIRFTLESKQRPKLAQEIGNILGTVPHYERVPSCAYDIAGYRLDKEGVLHIPEGAEETTKRPDSASYGSVGFRTMRK